MLMLDYLRGRLQGVAGNLAVEALSPSVARVMVAQGARRLGSRPSEGLRDVAALRTLFSSQGLLALFDAPWVVVYVGVIWLAHPMLGMAAALSAPADARARAGQRLADAGGIEAVTEVVGPRDALSRSLDAQRRGGPDARHDRCAARALARAQRRGHCAAAARRAQDRGAGGPHAHGAPVGAGAAAGARRLAGDPRRGDRRRDDRHHRAAGPRARAGRAGGRQLARAGRRARGLPPPGRAARRPRDAARAHGAAGAARAAAARRTWCTARRRASA